MKMASSYLKDFFKKSYRSKDKTVTQRRYVKHKERQFIRETEANKRRNISTDRDILINKSLQDDGDPQRLPCVNQHKKKLSLEERLKKYKTERQKRLEEEKMSKKPIFKTGRAKIDLFQTNKLVADPKKPKSQVNKDQEPRRALFEAPNPSHSTPRKIWQSGKGYKPRADRKLIAFEISPIKTSSSHLKKLSENTLLDDNQIIKETQEHIHLGVTYESKNEFSFAIMHYQLAISTLETKIESLKIVSKEVAVEKENGETFATNLTDEIKELQGLIPEIKNMGIYSPTKADIDENGEKKASAIAHLIGKKSATAPSISIISESASGDAHSLSQLLKQDEVATSSIAAASSTFNVTTGQTTQSNTPVFMRSTASKATTTSSAPVFEPSLPLAGKTLIGSFVTGQQPVTNSAQSFSILNSSSTTNSAPCNLAPAPVATFSFGQASSQAPSSTTFSIGQTTAAANSTPSNFGQTSKTASSAPFSFGQMAVSSGRPTSSTAAPFAFGQLTTTASSTPFGFSQTSTASTANPTLFNFGQAAGSTNSPFAFGASKTQAVSGSIFVSSSGTSAVTTSAMFGSTATVTIASSIFGTGSVFGASTNVTTMTTAIPTFGSFSTPVFGTPSISQQNPAFGATATIVGNGGFGSSSSSLLGTSFNFSGGQTQQANTYGSQPTNSTSSGFNFTLPTTQPALDGVFHFSAKSSARPPFTAPSPGGFNFAATPNPGGFNFSATPATQNMYTPQTPASGTISRVATSETKGGPVTE